jgi:hypothetical protein
MYVCCRMHRKVILIREDQGLYEMAFSIFREIRLTLHVGCDYHDYRNFFRQSDNRYFAIIAIIAIITYTK